jgi:RNA polymerase sigma-70 factor (ECF subfamily)
MFTIVRNKTVDLLRRSYGGERASVAFVDDAQPANDHDLAHEFSVGNIFAQLQPNYRNALELTKVFGYSLSEAAERSGISESAMKSRVSRAVRAAEVLLNQERNVE